MEAEARKIGLAVMKYQGELAQERSLETIVVSKKWHEAD